MGRWIDGGRAGGPLPGVPGGHPRAAGRTSPTREHPPGDCCAPGRCPGRPGETARPLPLPAPAPDRKATEPAPIAPGETSQAQATDDDFMADMQSILTGRKVFDPASGRTVEKDKLGRSPVPSPRPEPPPAAPDGQAIFDRIAQSMAYANTYRPRDRRAEQPLLGFRPDAAEPARRKRWRASATDPPARAPARTRYLRTSIQHDARRVIRGQPPRPDSGGEKGRQPAPCAGGESERFTIRRARAGGGDLYPDRLRVGERRRRELLLRAAPRHGRSVRVRRPDDGRGRRRAAEDKVAARKKHRLLPGQQGRSLAGCQRRQVGRGDPRAIPGAGRAELRATSRPTCCSRRARFEPAQTRRQPINLGATPPLGHRGGSEAVPGPGEREPVRVPGVAADHQCLRRPLSHRRLRRGPR